MSRMNIVIVTDAWHPQVNGVVRTLENTGNQLRDWGHDVTFVTPLSFRTLALPGYPEIRVSILPRRRMRRMLEVLQPDAVHLATEGPLGWAARNWCLANDIPFTTSYHTQFPEYLKLRSGLPLGISYAVLRRFHAPAVRTLVPTRTQKKRLLDRGFEHVGVWSRGVDVDIFRPYGKATLDHLPRPVSLYFGRVAIEKNIDAFLDLDLPGSKVVIGDGPDLERLKTKYPDAHFLGAKFGEDLARHIAAADVFVFPSRTDTFGLVLLEAMACGVPVAAYPVTGPIDVIENNVTGVLDDDLGKAVQNALKLNGRTCRAHALHFSWETCTADFLHYLQARDDGPYLGMPLRVSTR